MGDWIGDYLFGGGGDYLYYYGVGDIYIIVG